MAENLEERVMRVVSDVFGIERAQVSLRTSVDDVESWDSFNIVKLMLALEDEFGLRLSPQEAVELMSVEAIVGLLRGKGAA